MIFEIFRFLHFVGLAWGVGGATVVSIISAKADKDNEIGRIFMKIVPAISKLIWLGILLLIISGVGIAMTTPYGAPDRQLFIIKLIAFALLVAIGIFIGFKIRKMKLIAPSDGKKPLAEFLRIKKQLKILSIVNLIIWYVIIGISVFL